MSARSLVTVHPLENSDHRSERFAITEGLEITGTNRAIRLVDKKPMRASCLIAMVFDNKSLVREPSQKHG
jgi:hypothetical protein